MALEDLLESIQNFDVDQLSDLNSVGSWPLAIKIMMWVGALVGALALGYFLHITNLQNELGEVVRQESELKVKYESKAEDAYHLEAHKAQQLEMERRFQNILGQLPSDTEIPGLIEDITLVGLENGLVFESIELQPELTHEFYIEKPIRIIVAGDYHDLGSFVSGVADLSRIVTLHDFSIRPTAGSDQQGQEVGARMLRMAITAKTYRYNDERG